MPILRLRCRAVENDETDRSHRPTQVSAISRGRRAADDKHQSIKLTMKVAPSKLREVTRANEVDSLQDTLGGGKVIDGPRSRRAATANVRANVRASAARPRYIEYGESDIEDEEDEDEGDRDAEGDKDGEMDRDGNSNGEVTNDFDKLGAEAEGSTDEEEEEEEEEEDEEDEEDDDDNDEDDEEEEEDDDEDVEMDDAPPIPPSRKQQPQPKPPKITLKPPPKTETKQGAKAKIIVTPAQVGPLKSVEDQEMEDDLDEEDDEESSELSEDEDATNLNEDADGEGGLLGEGDLEGEEELDEDDMDDDSGDETPASGAATPDPNRLTKRQRGRPEDATQLMALDMAPQQRKFFTDEEKAMKKDEHARKRKELTKRKILEEKTAALNRLLKPQVSKARGAAPKPETLAAAAAAAVAEEDEMVEKANPLFTRWISTKEGVRLGVPEEWLGKKAGRVFGPPVPAKNGVLVQEVE